MIARLRWLIDFAIDFAIDYGSIALIAAIAVGYLSAGVGLLGGPLGLLALKLWNDVQEDRRAERLAREVG